MLSGLPPFAGCSANLLRVEQIARVCTASIGYVLHCKIFLLGLLVGSPRVLSINLTEQFVAMEVMLSDNYYRRQWRLSSVRRPAVSGSPSVLGAAGCKNLGRRSDESCIRRL